MKTRPDNYRVNKTGQLQKLTTASPSSLSIRNSGAPARASGFAKNPLVRLFQRRF